MTGQVVDTITNIKTVKLFAQAGHEDQAALGAMETFRDRAIVFGRLNTWFRTSLTVVAGLLPVVLVGGAVTHRQRPATAAGVTFVNLEDETGMVNVVCSVGLWAKYRKLAQTAPALLIRGRVQNAEGAVTVVADRLQRMDLRVGTRSRDWH